MTKTNGKLKFSCEKKLKLKLLLCRSPPHQFTQNGKMNIFLMMFHFPIERGFVKEGMIYFLPMAFILFDMLLIASALPPVEM